MKIFYETIDRLFELALLHISEKSFSIWPIFVRIDKFCLTSHIQYRVASVKILVTKTQQSSYQQCKMWNLFSTKEPKIGLYEFW